MSASASYGLLAFPLLLSIAQFLSDKINIERSRYRQHLASFAAAISITYLLLSFLPETYAGGFTVLGYLPLVLGFVAIHLLEKFIYRRFSSSGRFSLRRIKTYHDDLHAVIIFSYHLIIGVVLMNFLKADLQKGLLFLPPLLMFTTIGNWSVHHHYVTQNRMLRLVLASATIIGAASAVVFDYKPFLYKILLSFAAGILLFVVVRESLPKEKEGKPLLFILGVMAYTALILFFQ